MASRSVSSGGRMFRTTGIGLFSLAAVLNLMSSIGTACVAMNPTGWSAAMARLAPFQWLYRYRANRSDLVSGGAAVRP